MNAVEMVVRCGKWQGREDEYGRPIVPYVTAMELGAVFEPIREIIREAPPLPTFCDRCGVDHAAGASSVYPA